MTAVEDRRQAAREAYWDDMRGLSMRTQGIETAIETATRVRIDIDIVRSALKACDPAAPSMARMTMALVAAFRAAGFEVEE